MDVTAEAPCHAGFRRTSAGIACIACCYAPRPSPRVGWAFCVVVEATRGEFLFAGHLAGEVVIDAEGPQYVGAEYPSNNSAEYSRTLRGNPASTKQNSWDTEKVWWAPMLVRGKLHIEHLPDNFPRETERWSRGFALR